MMVRVPSLACAFVLASGLSLQVGTLEELTRSMSALGWLQADDARGVRFVVETTAANGAGEREQRPGAFILPAQIPDDFHGDALQQELAGDELLLALGSEEEADASTPWSDPEDPTPNAQRDPNSPWTGAPRPFSPDGYAQNERGSGPQRSFPSTRDTAFSRDDRSRGAVGGGGGSVIGPLASFAGGGSDNGGGGGNTGPGQPTVTTTADDLTPVPLPAGAWLLLSGLGALAFKKRKA